MSEVARQVAFSVDAERVRIRVYPPGLPELCLGVPKPLVADKSYGYYSAKPQIKKDYSSVEITFARSDFRDMDLATYEEELEGYFVVKALYDTIQH